MTISPYQVDSVIKAYSRQSRMKVRSELPQEMDNDKRYMDVVSLSMKDNVKTDAFTKISYSLLDVILRDGDK